MQARTTSRPSHHVTLPCAPGLIHTLIVLRISSPQVCHQHLSPIPGGPPAFYSSTRPQTLRAGASCRCLDHAARCLIPEGVHALSAAAIPCLCILFSTACPYVFQCQLNPVLTPPMPMHDLCPALCVMYPCHPSWPGLVRRVSCISWLVLHTACPLQR